MPRRRVIDRWLLGAALLAASFGVVMVGSASAHVAVQVYDLPPTEFAFRQLIAVLIGVLGMLAATFVPLSWATDRRLALPALLLTWAALGAAFLQSPVSGTHRWLRLPIGSFQPSAVAKLTLPLALAALLAQRRERPEERRLVFGVALGMIVLTCAVVLLEPDLGSAGLLFVAGAVILLLAGMSWRPMAAVGACGVLVVAVAILAAPYRRERLLSFLGDPSYQVRQSLIALGGGGLLGRGPGESVQKLFFLPQPHGDFIFAIIGEELGFIGATLTLAVLAVIVVRGLSAAWRASSRPAALLGGGLAAAIATQALFNVSVCIDLLPAKGIPLPLVSAGGSDVVMTFVAIGLLLNIGKEAL
jgi:cell division protein FtsW